LIRTGAAFTHSAGLFPAGRKRQPGAGALALRATMRDVAALVGVRLKTVSRVVNGAPTADAELAARVRRAAAQLSYRHNMTTSRRWARPSCS
jgi:hypothetical protein